MYRSFLLIALANLALTVLACRWASTKPYRPTDADLAERNKHWLHDERLRQVMMDLERSANSTWPQEIQAEYARLSSNEKAQALAEACSLSEALAAAAERIPKIVQHNEMSEVDRRSFQAQVHTLRDQALRLGEVSTTGDLRRMRTVLDSIGQTCMSCHHRFRDYSGPLGRP